MPIADFAMREPMLLWLIIPLGLAIGSFLNVCIARVPLEQSIAHPASHCPKCGTPLLHRDMIPVVSYMLLGGKCRHCHQRISGRYPLVELLCAALFALAFAQCGLSLPFASYAILFALLIVAAFIDLEHQIIPNGTVLIGLIAALPYQMLMHGLPQGLQAYFLGLLAGALPLILVALIGRLVFKREAMGGGDIKLMAMVGATLGWQNGLLALLLGVVAGGVAGAVLLARKKASGTTEMPLGPMLALGSVLAALWGTPLLHWYMGLFGL
nr:A24 family peptidase [Maliibacterium massiliense]